MARRPRRPRARIRGKWKKRTYVVINPKTKIHKWKSRHVADYTYACTYGLSNKEGGQLILNGKQIEKIGRKAALFCFVIDTIILNRYSTTDEWGEWVMVGHMEKMKK